jgi:DNA-binding SARP family transcriptional activator
MHSSLITSKSVSVNSPEILSLARLWEVRGEDLSSMGFADTLALLSSASAQNALDQSQITALFNMLSSKHAKFMQIQQKMQEILTLFTEITTDMQHGLATLQSESLQPSQGANKSPMFPVQNPTSSSFYAICLGPFTLYSQGQPVKLCSNRNARTILRLLIAQPDHSVSVDTLLDLLWPDDPADVALRKLHVTLSHLRNKCSPYLKIIQYQQGVYRLDPAIKLYTDVDEFLFCYQTGQNAKGKAAISYFENACSLYTRPFLLEDLYSDWSFARREQLRQIYLTMSSILSSHYLEVHDYDTATHWALEIIKENACDESAHCQLMRIYAHQGRRNDALRQYQYCQRILHEELNLQPLPDTENLYQAILQGEFSQ